MHEDNVKFYGKLSKISGKPTGISSLQQAQSLTKKLDKIASIEKRNQVTDNQFL